MKRTIVMMLLIVFACKKSERVAAGLATADLEQQAVATRNGVAAVQAQPARMIIRTASVSLVVRDAGDALNRLTAMIESRNGYVAESKQWKERDQVRASATVRVPSGQLSQALAAIRGLAIRVESENISADDVSQEYTDLDAQVRNLQATETELRELLKTVRQRTQKASEILEVFNELTKTRGEIDRIQGRMKYLSQLTSLSTINLELIPDVLAKPVIEPGWQPVATVKQASRSLVKAMQFLTDASIWIGLYLLPLGLLFAMFGLVIRAIVIRLHPQRSA